MSVGWFGFVGPGGAGVVASVAVAVRAGPLEDSGRDHAVVPGGEGLEPVVVATQRGRGSSVVVGPGCGLPSAAASWSYSVMWSTSQRRAGRVHHGNTQVRSRRVIWSRMRSGISYAGVESSAVRSMTGLMVTDVRESPHQLLIWSRRTSRWPCSMRPVGPKTVCSPTTEASKWAWTTTSRAGGSPSPSVAPVVTLVEQVERGLGAGEVAEGLGAAYVEGLGRAECLLQSRRRGRGPGRGRGRRRGRGRPRGAACRRSGRRRG